MSPTVHPWWYPRIADQWPILIVTTIAFAYDVATHSWAKFGLQILLVVMTELVLRIIELSRHED